MNQYTLKTVKTLSVGGYDYEDKRSFQMLCQNLSKFKWINFYFPLNHP